MPIPGKPVEGNFRLLGVPGKDINIGADVEVDVDVDMAVSINQGAPFKRLQGSLKRRLGVDIRQV